MRKIIDGPNNPGGRIVTDILIEIIKVIIRK
jgi:hypothetical protein